MYPIPFDIDSPYTSQFGWCTSSLQYFAPVRHRKDRFRFPLLEFRRLCLSKCFYVQYQNKTPFLDSESYHRTLACCILCQIKLVAEQNIILILDRLESTLYGYNQKAKENSMTELLHMLLRRLATVERK